MRHCVPVLFHLFVKHTEPVYQQVCSAFQIENLRHVVNLKEDHLINNTATHVANVLR